MRFSWIKVVLTGTVFFITSIFSPVFAWNESGHMLVAKIAYEKLNPTARAKIDKLVSYLHQEYDEITTFSQAAVWADKLRGQQLDVYTHWHYIDIPLVKDGGDANANIIDSDNAMWAIDKIRSFISNDKANPYERARFLAFLVHIVADVHQPLHTVSLVTPKFPKGDRGGNDYFVSYKNKRTNVHKIWDEGVGAFEKSDPEDDARESQLNFHANSIASRYPLDYFNEKLAESNTKQWLKEGMDIASRYVYSVPENQEVSAEYIQKGAAISEQQVALAGYRLAQMLNQVFK